MPEDEVVFLQFEATDAAACRTVLARAGIDHERILQTVRPAGRPPSVGETELPPDNHLGVRSRGDAEATAREEHSR